MRYRFVDSIQALQQGESIYCRYSWPEDLEIFEDHFPGFAVVPGVLLVEMMGQSASLCLQDAFPQYGLPMLLQVEDARFRKWVHPAMLLDIHATVLSAQPRLAKIEARTEHEGKTVATAKLLFSYQDKNELGLSAQDPVLTDWYNRTSQTEEGNP